MSVFIRGKVLKVAAQGPQSGYFIGQNIQNGWDSISPLKTATGFSMGDVAVIGSVYSGFLNLDYVMQAVMDNDFKNNGSTSNQWSR